MSLRFVSSQQVFRVNGMWFPEGPSQRHAAVRSGPLQVPQVTCRWTGPS